MMADRCLCYTTDRGYALPTLVSAAQAREHLSEHADVVVILIGAAPSEADALAEACRAFRIILVRMPQSAIDDLPVNLARHHLDRLLDVRYRRIVHIDGDTQVLGSLDALLDAVPAPGRIIAALDPMALMIDGEGSAWARRRAYFASIGIGPRAAQRYVNTGMFGARREDLAAVGGECLRLITLLGKRLVFNEQDAFNLAFESCVDLASLRWNYPAFFSNFSFGSVVEPHVRHFMSNPRPWQGPFVPWGAVGHAPYLKVLRDWPQLGQFQTRLTRKGSLRYAIQQRFKRAVEPRSWDTPAIRARLQRNEASAFV